MRLQELVIREQEELFFRGGTRLSAGETLSFDTYFNSFCYTKYRDFTSVRGVEFSCRFDGKARVQLCVFDGEERVIRETEGTGTAKLSAEFSELPENGFLFPKLTALSDGFVFLGGEYSSECSPAAISVCAAICTFRRERFVLQNLELLKGFEFSFLKRVFVVDNGNTLDAAALSDGFINVLPNRNFGGSGGFTRGLIEARDNGFSHVILMDDDIEVLPQTIEQMTVFMSLLLPQYSESWFSAAMLPLDKPWEQFELGADWNGKSADVHKHRADIRKRAALLDNLDNPNVGYGGWWKLCMPISVTERGLPFPFFIKFDDVEYGLRRTAGTEIITMNGIAVRHEAFDRKTSFVLDYYNLRNELVTNAVCGKGSAFSAAKRFLYEVCKELALYRYDNCELVFRGARDFLGGVDFFLGNDEEKLNGELIRTAPKLCPLSEIPQWDESLRCDDREKDIRFTPAMLLTFAGHLIPAFLLKKEPYATPLSRVDLPDFFGRKEAVQYQLGSDSGILTKRSAARFFKYGFRALGLSLRLLFGYKKAAESYCGRKGEITSVEFWKKHLGL